MKSSLIKLRDNGDVKISDGVAMKLRRYAGLRLDALCGENPSLLIFPNCLGDNGDRINEGRLFSLNGDCLSVGNIVGFWGVDDVNVRVHSRFDMDDRQYFFHYMLQRICKVNVIDMQTLPDEEDLWDFLIYLSPMALKGAMRQGIFRAYRVFRYDDDQVRGAIDVARYIRHDIPFSGRVSYSTREHTADNHVIQLVRHAVEFIRRRKPDILSVDGEMRQAVDTIVQLTPDYSEKSRQRIMAANLRPVRHPYYSAYTGLQRICLRILRHEKIAFGENDGRICGIVFDAAWLWEEYLNSLFEDAKGFTGVVHPMNKTCQNPVYFFEPKRGPHYPDFYDEKRRVVMDAKYKNPDNGIPREDLFQLISYIHVMAYRSGMLLYPSHATGFHDEGRLKGLGGHIGWASLMVPKAADCAEFRNFEAAIRNNEGEFLRLLGEYDYDDNHS